jgi:hypothetical protein
MRSKAYSWDSKGNSNAGLDKSVWGCISRVVYGDVEGNLRVDVIGVERG